MAAEVFDGFDHTQYKDEVTERWGKEAYESGDRWWRSLSDAEKKSFQQTQLDIAADFGKAHAAGLPVAGETVQAIVARHRAWLGDGTQGRPVTDEYLLNLGEMYVADPRFRQNYDVHGDGTAEYIREAFRAYVAGRNA